jgi:amino acid adenylation domain-containing protein
MGVRPEVIVGVSLERSTAMLIALLAVLKAGGAYLPLDLSLPAERLRLTLEDARAAILITQSQPAERVITSDLHALYRVICMDTEWARIAQERPENLVNATTSDNLAYVIYTSGSTGKPKGAMIHHRGLVNYLSWCVRRYDVAAGKGTPVHSPISFDLTVTSLFAPLLAGRCVWLPPESHGGAALHQALLEHRDFSLVKLTPAHLEALSHALPALDAAGRTRALVVGGEELKAESLAFWREYAPETRLINEYGPTETVVGCCVYEVSQNTPTNEAVPIGRPIANTQIYALDTQFNPVPADVAGELHVGGVGLARGYLGRPELTAEKFIPDPFGSWPGARLYRTGDLARHLLDGNLEYIGRVDHQVKVRGFRIELGEIESTLRRHSAVREAVVLARQTFYPSTTMDTLPNGPSSPAVLDQSRRLVKSRASLGSSAGDKRLVAYLVRADDSAPTAAELREFLSASLPDYMIPSAFVMLDALPTNANGKLDRRALQELEFSVAPERVSSQPASELERTIAGIWREALDRSDVDIDTSFFDLGGNSMLAARVYAALQSQVSQNITLLALFQYPTVRSLAEHLSQSVNTDEQALQDSRRDAIHAGRRRLQRALAFSTDQPNKSRS